MVWSGDHGYSESSTIRRVDAVVNMTEVSDRWPASAVIYEKQRCVRYRLTALCLLVMTQRHCAPIVLRLVVHEVWVQN